MFGLPLVRFWVYAAIAVLIAGLAWTANHYHNSWVEAQQIIAVKTSELNSALAAAKTCSENTKLLSEQTKEKAAVVAKAQAQAAIIAKNNQALAQKLLSSESSDTNRCQAAVKLYKDYRAQSGSK